MPLRMRRKKLFLRQEKKTKNNFKKPVCGCREGRNKRKEEEIIKNLTPLIQESIRIFEILTNQTGITQLLWKRGKSPVNSV